jgi:regulatory protein
LLSRRAWTRAELSARLRRRGAPPDVVAELVADLVARGYLDDAAYARHWVSTRTPRGYGAARLRAELRARGVASLVIDAALATVAGDDVLGRAREAAQRRLPALRRARPERAAARLRDYLLRRGFSASVVTRVVRESMGVAAEE